VGAALQREDDYVAPGEPACDWTDQAAREALVDALVRDGYRAHYALRGERLNPRVAEAAALLATVTGQDIEETSDGRFRIFEGTAPDRVISTADPQARHGHKTAAHGFDGYKAHVAIDPDAEVICAAEVSTATTGDAVVGPMLLGEVASDNDEQAARAVIYGDSAYGTGTYLAWLERQGCTPMVKTQVPTAPGRAVRQGPVPPRPPSRHTDLPGPGHGEDPPRPPRWGPRPVQSSVQRLPAAGYLHDQSPGSDGCHPPPRGRADRSPRPPARPRLAG
jgi:hypothetical protein